MPTIGRIRESLTQTEVTWQGALEGGEPLVITIWWHEARLTGKLWAERTEEDVDWWIGLLVDRWDITDETGDMVPLDHPDVPARLKVDLVRAMWGVVLPNVSRRVISDSATAAAGSEAVSPDGAISSPPPESSG